MGSLVHANSEKTDVWGIPGILLPASTGVVVVTLRTTDIVENEYDYLASITLARLA
jgi:hypothetical protein